MVRKTKEQKLEEKFDELYPREAFVDSGVYGTCKRWWIKGAMECTNVKFN